MGNGLDAQSLIPPAKGDSYHMPEEQSVISGIQARYDHENTIPKTIDINPKDPDQINTMINSNEGGYDVFNNYPAQAT